MDLNAVLTATDTGTRSRIDRAAGRLVGSRCENCGSVSWPARAVCQRCGEAGTRELRLSDRGTLVTFTRVWVPRPGLPTPYVLGQVDIEDGVRIFAHGRGIGEDHHVPLAVRIVLNEVPDVVPPFYFEPLEV